MKIKNVELAKTSFIYKEIINDRLPKIVFIGRSNVGKSSLINKLLNRKKMARISSKPGKTVSINYYLINEEFYFIDLPGYGFAKISKKERERVKALVADFFEKTENIKLIVILIDSRRGFMNPDLEILLKIVEKNFKVLTTLTKCDKVTYSFLENQTKNLQERFGLNVIPFSIKSNIGKEKLIKHINKALKE